MIYFLALLMVMKCSSEALVLSNYITSLLHEIVLNLGFRNIKTFSGFETYVGLSVSQMQWILLFIKEMSFGY